MSQDKTITHPLFEWMTGDSIRFLDITWEAKYPGTYFGRTPDKDKLRKLWMLFSETEGPVFPQGRAATLIKIANLLEESVVKLSEQSGRVWPPPAEDKPVLSRLQERGAEYYTLPSQGEGTMAKTATAPAKPAASKPPVNGATKTAQAAAQADAATEAAFNSGEKAEAKPREGKAPGGKTWVQWFKDENAKGRSAEELQKEYVELRTSEYEGKIDVLKRHAYRHRKLALPNSGPNVKEAASE